MPTATIITWEEWDKLGEMSRDIAMKWNGVGYTLIPIKRIINFYL